MLRVMSKHISLDAALTLFVTDWLAIPSCESVPQKQLDEPEQMLIHLLGRDLLLNSQPGGYLRSYRPRPDDLMAIQHLHLDLRSDRLDVSSLHERGNKVHAIYVKGDDMPQPHPLASHFNLRKMTVERALGKELGKSAIDPCRRRHQRREHVKDLGNVDAQTKVLVKVLSALEYPIVATIGIQPAQAAMSNFHGRDSMNEATYKRAMDREPFVSNMDAYKTAPVDDKAKDIHCVVVSMIHPGHVSYGPGAPVEMRLLLLQLARALLLSDCANKAAREPDAAPKMTRRFCERVKELWRDAERNSGLDARIHEAADAYSTHVHDMGQARAAKRHAMTDAQRQEFATSSAKRMKALANDYEARGAPHSEEGQAQIDEIIRDDHSRFKGRELWGTPA
ncbi:hypothetical protein BC940DRAFT_328749 [Gongronella butleri]|nr:hypothetical protein BC940DRAFT_328749 [Gongronella butleri]